MNDFKRKIWCTVAVAEEEGPWETVNGENMYYIAAYANGDVVVDDYVKSENVDYVVKHAPSFIMRDVTSEHLSGADQVVVLVMKLSKFETEHMEEDYEKAWAN